MADERDIEKELKAYAQQRQADAGAPMELAPEKRKALQAEAARMARSPEPANLVHACIQILFGTWSRVAMTGAVAVLVVLGAGWLLLPLSSDKAGMNHPTEQFAANRKLMDEPSSPKAAEKSPIHAATALADREPMTTRRATGSFRNTNQVAVETLADNAPVATPAPAPASIPAPVVLAKGMENKSKVTTAESQSISGALGGAATPAENFKANGYTLNFYDSGATPIVQPFRRSDIAVDKDKLTNADLTKNVLASFRVEQAREKLRMIDSDGSVYVGFLSQSNASQEQMAANKKTEVVDQLKTGSADQKLGIPRFYRFRVSGTNLTLNQPVIFSGNFQTTISNAAFGTASAGEPTGSVNASTAGQANVFELPKSSVEGSLRIGESNQFEIRAVPVKANR